MAKHEKTTIIHLAPPPIGVALRMCEREIQHNTDSHSRAVAYDLGVIIKHLQSRHPDVMAEKLVAPPVELFRIVPLK